VCLCCLGGSSIGFGFCLVYFEECFSWVFLGFWGFFLWVLGVLLGYSQVSFGGFSYFVEVSNMLVRGFLVGFLWVFLGFYVG
jgi:hypothetical protein